MIRENIGAIYALSPMQQGMLFHSLYAPQSGLYFQQLCCVLEGNLDLTAFEHAWQQAIERHGLLGLRSTHLKDYRHGGKA